MTLALDGPVTQLSGVGPAAATKLERLEIRSIRDLVEHFPRRYEDAGEVKRLDAVDAGEKATLLGEIVTWDVWSTTARKTGRSLRVARATVRQASGDSFQVTFFNQPWRADKMPRGTIGAFSGEVKRFRGAVSLTNPETKVLDHVDSGVSQDDAAARLRHRRLLPIYPATAEMTSLRIAHLVEDALAGLGPFEDWLPADMRQAHGVIDLDTAMRHIHQPQHPQQWRAAKHRLVFDELLTLQLGLRWRRARLTAATVGRASPPTPRGMADRLLDFLPFPATSAQQRAFDEIGEDLARVTPMHRLLQGDVGSGKTLVALWTMLCAVDNGRQAALMVPTEVLAEQHYRTLVTMLEPFGVNMLDGIRIDVLTSSTPVTKRRRILGELLTGELDIIIGTHALLEEGVRFADLAVVVIDEQHRFGVSQRLQLKEKASQDQRPQDVRSAGIPPPDDGSGVPADVLPDVLVMTATPIPRSLALTLYGDLDVTVLDELPPGRQPVTTELIRRNEQSRRDEKRTRRDDLYSFIRQEAAAGRRTYIVCPLVEESEAVPATAAISEHQRLSTEVFADFEVELVHGQMRPEDKDTAMQRFRSGDAQILVATTVIEVGVDVPEASVMVIEDAERFGISQLHQLRGRVGRGAARSYCVLFAGWKSDLTKEAINRLEAVASTTDGFALADADLALRGEGALFGPEQSGTPELKLTRIQNDRELAVYTRDVAERIIERDPDLEDADVARFRAEVVRRFGGWERFAQLQTG